MSDALIWDLVDKGFCLFKVKPGKGQDFCRNEYNVSGLCNRQLCPLANAQYATVKNIDGRLFLYMKTPERAHMPKHLWERVKLLKNYTRAMLQIEQHLPFWLQFLVNKCKQRLTRLTQVQLTERRLALAEEERLYVGVRPKVRRRERARERKALAAAKIERAIETELLDRLKSSAYGDKPLNVDEGVWRRVLGQVDEAHEEEFDEEDNVVLESGDELDVGNVEYVEDQGEDEFVDMEDLERWLDSDASESEDEPDRKKPRAARPRVEIEYEHEPLTNLAT